MMGKVSTRGRALTATLLLLASCSSGPPKSNNADLAALELSAGTLTPAFTAAEVSYSASVENAVNSVTVTPTVADAGASVTVQGTAVASGAASAPIRLTVGVSGITVVVTAADGARKTYTIELTRAASGTVVEVDELASRKLGVAPLAVFFDAIAPADVIHPPQVDGRREYADLHYEWNFGDASAGVWALDGYSKGSATGYVAAHVYEQPGTYLTTLTVSDASGMLGTYTVTIEVQDPAVIFSANATICFSNTTDFTGCPLGAQSMGNSSNVADLSAYLVSGRRILLHRGHTWSCSATIAMEIEGPLIVGAFGACTNPDARGLCENAPLIQVSNVDAVFDAERAGIHDVRFMDLAFTDVSGTSWGALGSTYLMTQVLELRLRTTGFETPLGNGHWEHRGHDQVTVTDCDSVNSRSMIIYIGSNRLALLGNRFHDALGSHVARVWHAPKGVIEHNELSGSSVQSDSGRHALKLHGPHESELVDTGPAGLDGRTQYVIVADNVFGQSGPWPLAVGPQDDINDERLADLVIERNRFYPGFGTSSCCSSGVQVAVMLWADYATVRNNIFTGEGSSAYYKGITIARRGIEPDHRGNRVFNNTFYKVGTSDYEAIVIETGTLDTLVRNNLVQLSGAAVVDRGANTVADHNLLTSDAQLIDPDNTNFLQKNFRPASTSPASNAGVAAPVFDDFSGTARPADSLDLGAYEIQ